MGMALSKSGCSREPVSQFAPMVVVLLVNIGFSTVTAEPIASFRVTPAQLELDEGDVAEFRIVDKTYTDPISREDLAFEADLSPVTWFWESADEPPAKAYGLYNIKHRFWQDEDAPRRVRVRHQLGDRDIVVRINDVQPVIYRTSVSPLPQPGKPVVFQAGVWDPGMFDEHEYLWSNGDERTDSKNAIFTWSQPGRYEVQLSVRDKNRNDPPATVTIPVHVDSELGTEFPNTFSVGGDITGEQLDIDGLVLVGTPVARNSGFNDCQLRIEVRSDDLDMGVVLTARLSHGLTPGHYPIGETNEWDGAYKQEAENRNMFFAELYPPQDLAVRVVNAQRRGGPFWGERGRVSITRFQEGELLLDFEAAFTEQIPAGLHPRRASARGRLQVSVVDQVTAEEVEEDPGRARDIPGMNAIARSALRGDSRNLRINSFGCDGEEPGHFELVDATPGSNEFNYNFEKSVIALEFSQAVDPDSIVDLETRGENLSAAYRTVGALHAEVPGTWMISPRNPKVVEFVPQARLLPGVVHCVYVKTGDGGLRSIAGNLLSGSALDAPTERMRQACPSVQARIGYSFATRVEMESVRVDLYQASLLGPHAKYAYVGGGWAVARVYPWWQPFRPRLVHEVAQVREFDAKIFAAINRQGLQPIGEVGAGNGFVRWAIKRPDLYSESERRAMRHSYEFMYRPASRPGALDYVGVVQPLDKRGQPVTPPDTSPMYSLATSEPLALKVALVNVGINCNDQAEACEWPPGAVSALNLRAALSINLPQSKIDITTHTLAINTDEDCPGGLVNGTDCFDNPPASLAARLQSLDEQLSSDSSIFGAGVDIVLVQLPDGWNPDARQSMMYLGDSNREPPVVGFITGAVRETAVTRAIVASLLGDNFCRFASQLLCNHTPVQGLVQLVAPDRVVNRHHFEGYELAGFLAPLAHARRDSAQHEYHISAWNYARLYDALQ
ncbi:MAG: PKD domain-containing protein [Gammaproteobacteria bacterium]|nr:PKD domain-containing protein [Gammaproteobacteria bacterium]